MEAISHAEHHHHEMPSEGRALTGVAVSATLHCLTGCAIGEVTGMVVGTALGFSDLGTIALAVALAFLFGYTLTSLPLLRAGLALSAVIPIALAADTLSIAVMEIVDNLIMVAVPGAMESGVGDLLFWGALAVALVIAFVVTVPVNRWLLARGKGHTAVHETGIHGGPPTRVVGAAVIAAAVFGTTVLIAEAVSEEGPAGGGHGGEATAEETRGGGGHAAVTAEPDPVRGLSASENGFTLGLSESSLVPGEGGEIAFTVTGEDGAAVTDFDVEHEKRMHLIVVREDLTGFQHLHPRMSEDGEWSTPITVPDAGTYRVFADFVHEGESTTLAGDLAVGGDAPVEELPAPSVTATAGDGYEVAIEGESAAAGEASGLAFTVNRNGEAAAVEPYLGADGHLVALREGDLAFLHTHPEESAGDGSIRFETEFPSAGAYRLFLQFKDGGEVRTAAFTREVD